MVCRDPGHSAIFSLLKYGLLEYDCCSSETSVLQITVMRVTDTMPMSKYVKIFDRDGNQLNEWVNIYGNVTK